MVGQLKDRPRPREDQLEAHLGIRCPDQPCHRKKLDVAAVEVVDAEDQVDLRPDGEEAHGMAGKEDPLARIPFEIARRQHRRGQVECQRPQPLANLVANAEVVHPRGHVGLYRAGEEVKAHPDADAVVDPRLLVVIPHDRKHAELVAAAGDPVERAGRIAVSHEVAQRSNRGYLRRSVEVDGRAGDQRFAGSRAGFLMAAATGRANCSESGIPGSRVPMQPVPPQIRRGRSARRQPAFRRQQGRGPGMAALGATGRATAAAECRTPRPSAQGPWLWPEPPAG